MKKFKATACYSSYCVAEIKAVDADQAYEIARDMDGGDFTSTGDSDGDWRIIDVEEIEE